MPVAGAVIATGKPRRVSRISTCQPRTGGHRSVRRGSCPDSCCRVSRFHPRAPGDAVRATDEAVTGLGAANTPGDKTTLLATATAAVSGDADAMTQHGGRPDARFQDG